MRRNLYYLIIVMVSLVITENAFSQSAPPVTSVGTPVLADTIWSVPITVTGFANVGNISMKLNYDKTKLIYGGVVINSGLNPANTISTPASDQSGVFRLSYSSSQAIVLAAPTNTLMTIIFISKPNVVDIHTLLTWSTLQGDCEITPPVPGFFVPAITPANMETYFKDNAFDLTRTLNLTLQLEGLYRGGGVMNQAQGDAGNQYAGNTADIITVELHDPLTYINLIYTETDVALDNHGHATFVLAADYSGSYYITVIHRNSVETVSATPVSFASGTVNYTFSNLITKAYGSNMKNSGGVFLIYGGDVNQDGIIDLTDLILVGNEASIAGSGYAPEDINGDGLVDLTDLIMVGNNASQAIGSITP